MAKRPYTKRGKKAAAKQLKRISQDEFSLAAQFTEEQLDVLDRIAAGHPPRNAASVLKSMELKASYAYSKPKQQLEYGGEMVHRVVIERE